MKKTIEYVVLVGILILISSCKQVNEKDPNKDDVESSEAVAETTELVALANDSLSSTVPLEITVSTQPPTLESLQHDFDVFSWESFIALNWPANEDGTPNTNMVIGQDQNALTVWQSWKSSRDIFLKNGAQPKGWNEDVPPPVVCDHLNGSDFSKAQISLTQVGKTPNVLDESGEPFQTGPLIDQNGQYTRYEIFTNQSMFDYIVDNKLYNKKGQAIYNKDADFPSSSTSNDKVGAIMVKSAWVKMGGKYDSSKFHTTMALVYNNPEEQSGVKPACELVEVGLVGFHIAHKTEDEPQWVWSTFEHKDNVPTQNETADKDFYNFYDANSDMEVNEPPARPWNPAIPYTTPSQIERVIPITDDAKALNDKYHALLENAVPGSVWANYDLISTQWPTDATSVSDPTGKPAPSFLANTTLETYIQGTVEQTSSSCIACHNNASMTSGRFSDFTYLLQRAQTKK
ncbi:hypothetical protein LX97_02951 [Nonlabens dokdonensis]|jgi:hypothetical protein|uniref:Cytochrome c family protein n=2 Tax=Nonlabens dokdonensis TaxID=328515 RepID=L7WE97_NONDD|nr:hypothetical protein [Nonlabens dokdonensis]AGC78256.1 hypothetical protein DDD_3129 [Nonlabens dokdonensis DSW-6]PZX37856.1 hypothetical protein LX97_02951 [Nonlabens dokdonensis]